MAELADINGVSRDTQVLVLAPTRELALQVAEAFSSYATHMEDFTVLPIYGGSPYGPQLAGLRRGAQVVVGTPARDRPPQQRLARPLKPAIPGTR